MSFGIYHNLEYVNKARSSTCERYECRKSILTNTLYMKIYTRMSILQFIQPFLHNIKLHKILYIFFNKTEPPLKNTQTEK